jgi:3-hydroxybutyrate dehydrogenase
MFLKGKRALVTGSTSGIGLAIARAMHAEGAEVVLSGFGSDEEIAALCAELNARHVAADLMTAAGCEALITGAGEIDILVNNAGMQHVAPVDEFPVDKWDAIVALNLSAVFHACRLAVPGMKARGWGRIISTASAHSLVASPFKAPYVATKHAVAGFTKSLALELATSGITANCISPGYVWTALIENQIPDTMKTRNLSREAVINDVLLAKQPTKRFVQPEEVAALAVFLCREEAGNMTGANYSMDGGWTAE